jgi:hypothetical protein
MRLSVFAHVYSRFLKAAINILARLLTLCFTESHFFQGWTVVIVVVQHDVIVVPRMIVKLSL